MTQHFDLIEQLGLRRHPFPPTPDPMAYFQTSRMGRELQEVEHCLASHKGILLISGEVGLGKSTLLRHLLDDADPDSTRFALVLNTFLQDDELLAAICRDFGLTPGDGLGENLERLNAFLLERWAEGQTCVLMIDDAQNLSVSSLELVRLLSNLETGQEKLLQIVLCGQPEIEEVMARRELRQLDSRIVKRVRLEPLGHDEVPRYVQFRLDSAGGAGRFGITGPAARRLHQLTGGNLRRLHLVLDRCLYGLVGRSHPQIDVALVESAATDLGLPGARRRGPRVWRPVAAGVVLAVVLVAAMEFTSYNVLEWPVFAQDIDTSLSLPLHEAGDDVDRITNDAGQAPPTRLAAIDTRTGDEPEDAGGTAGRERPWPTEVAESPCLNELADRHGRSNVVLRPMPTALDKDDLVGWCRVELPHGEWIAHAVVAKLPVVEEIEAVQSWLASESDLAADGVDGILGPETRKALIAFQERHGLVPTGEPDALTRRVIQVMAEEKTE